MTATNDPRQANRRQTERRRQERRVVQYAYGTPEWIAYIQQNYLLWPKQDRRRCDRRKQDRRNISFERRNRESQRRLFRDQPKNIQDILTDEEKKLLMEVMQCDDKE